MGFAESTGHNLDVKVQVLDSVGSRIGSSALSAASLQQANQAFTQSVTRAASRGSERLAGGAEVSGEAPPQDVIITTVKF